MLTGKKLGDAIEKARVRKGVTKADLARQFGVQPPSIQGWINNGRISKPKIMEVIEYFSDVVGAEHWGLDSGALFPVVREPATDYAASDLTIAQYEAGGSMGHGRLMLEDGQPGVIKSWRVDREWLRLNVRHYTSEKNLCIVTGFGPSMRPRYNPGDPLLMDRGINTVETDGVYFFRVDDCGYIKQLQRIPTEGGTVIRARSYNPDYEPFDITKKMDFEVFGKILTIWKSELV